MRWLVLLVILIGLLARLPELSGPPLAFHPARQYRGAILARSFYLDRMRGLTPQEIAVARAATPTDTLEPPVLEHVAAWTYRLAGHEDLRIPRLISALAWALGAAALAWLLSQWGFSVAAILVGVAYMVLLPFGLVATPAIQPDSLMTALTILTVALAVRYERQPRVSGLMMFVLATAAAVFVKPMAIFFSGPVALTALVRRHGWIRGGALAAGCLLIAAMPVGIYFWTHSLPSAEYGLFTQLAGQSQYWTNWTMMINRVVGLVALMTGLGGLLVTPRGARAILAGWWLGYVAFGIAFAYRVSTYDYYSLPLIPVVAASLAALVHRIGKSRTTGAPGPWRLPITRGLTVTGVAAMLCANAATVARAGEFRSAADLRAEAAQAVAALPLTPPYGSVDAPSEPVVLSAGVVTFQGWALDDFDLRRVWAEYADASGTIVSVGDAKLTWMRPDVAAVNPAANDIYNSGWVLVLEPRALARMPRPVVLHFYTQNGDGRRAEIGKRTIVEK